jgi:tetratricopeptide (TPR) repeat protein
MSVREYLGTVLSGSSFLRGVRRRASQHGVVKFVRVALHDAFVGMPMLCVVGTLTLACAPVGQASTGKVASDKKPEQVIEVPTVVVTPLEDQQIQAEFERGKALVLAGDHRAAAELFDKLAKARPDSEVEPPCLYNAAVAYESFGAWDDSLARLRELLRRFPGYALERNALMRMGRTLAHVERWSELVMVSDQLLPRKDLALLEMVEVRGMRSLGLVEQDMVDDALREVSMARDIIERERFGEAGKPPMELAVVWFALGEVRRKKSEQFTFAPVPPNFAEVLERRCQGLLDAQRAYTDAMRSLDARWTAMAGYRLGQLYQDLYRDVMRIVPPAKADNLRKKQLFEGAMRLRYRVLLEKGLDMMNGTVRMGDRTGESSAWVSRAREAQRTLEMALQDEKAALAKMPFTEDELRAELEALKKKP